MELVIAYCAFGHVVISKQRKAAIIPTATPLLSTDKYRSTTTVLSILARNLQIDFIQRFYVRTRYIVPMPRRL